MTNQENATSGQGAAPAGQHPDVVDALYSIGRHARRSDRSSLEATLQISEALEILAGEPAFTRFLAAYQLEVSNRLFRQLDVDFRLLDTRRLVDDVVVRVLDTSNEQCELPASELLADQERPLPLLSRMSVRSATGDDAATSNPHCRTCILDDVIETTSGFDIERPLSAVARMIDPRSWHTCVPDVWIMSTPWDTVTDQPAVVAAPLGESWTGRLREVVETTGIQFDIVLDIALNRSTTSAVATYALHSQKAKSTSPFFFVRDDGYLEATALSPTWSRVTVVKRVNTYLPPIANLSDKEMAFRLCSWMTNQKGKWSACTP